MMVIIKNLVRFLKELFEPSGKDEGWDYNRFHGRYRVLYNDGEYSIPMCYDVAKDYAEIFGGRVVPKGEKL